MNLPLARLQHGQVVLARRPSTTGLAGRTEPPRLWDLMDADQQDQLLLAAEGIVACRDDPTQVPLIRAGTR